MTSGTVAPSDERVYVALEELQDLKSVWVELSKIWEQIDSQKDQPWLSIQPRKVFIEIVSFVLYMVARVIKFDFQFHALQLSVLSSCPLLWFCTVAAIS